MLLKKQLKSELHFKYINKNNIFDPPYINNENIGLLFSGGIDSIAAYHLIKNDKLKLISFDYGGQFINEKLSFINFNPFIIKTNFRQSLFFKRALKKYSLPGFSVGACLTAENLKLSYIGTGDILESDRRLKCHFPTSLLPTSLFNILQIRPVLGLTEIGTTEIVKRFSAPHEIASSLNSLANPGTAKRLRKDIILNFLGFKTTINKTSNPITFGRDYVMDFLFLFIYKYNSDLGVQMVTKVPNSIFDFIKNNDLSFYKKINLMTLINFPNQEILKIYLERLFSCGIEPYNLTDYTDLYNVSKLLASYHNLS